MGRWVDDPAASSMVHTLTLCLLRLTCEPAFAELVNKPCAQVLPDRAPCAAESSSGCVGDLLVGVVGAVVLRPSDPMLSLYPGALAVFSNIAPHVKAWTYTSSNKLFRMVGALAAPPVLFGTPSGPELLHSILEALVTALQFTHGSNARLLHGLALNTPLLRSLQTIPMPQPMAEGGREGSAGGSAGDGGGGCAPCTHASANGYLAGPEAWMTAEWMAEWQARLPVAPLLRVAEVIASKVSMSKVARRSCSSLTRSLPHSLTGEHEPAGLADCARGHRVDVSRRLAPASAADCTAPLPTQRALERMDDSGHLGHHLLA